MVLDCTFLRLPELLKTRLGMGGILGAFKPGSDYNGVS